MKSILKGGIVLGLGTLISKILGALYRIPLTNVLGSEGIGIYQTVFPFYSMLISLSSSGIPNGIAKLVAEGKNPKKVVYKSIIAFGGLGLLGSVTMFLLGGYIAKSQGNYQAKGLYAVLSPSVFLVSILSVVRGYHQGNGNLKPTGFSQIVEQLVKLTIGLGLAYFFADTPLKGALYATAAVTVSEVAALNFILAFFKPIKLAEETVYDKVKLSDITKVVFPITLTCLFLPLSKVADSFLIVNILKRYTESAVSYYGLYTGGVESIVGVPVSLCYGLAVAAVPEISKNKSGGGDKNVIMYTAVFALFSAAATFIFGKPAINLLYGGLGQFEKTIMIKLLNISSLSVILLPMMQTTNAILIAKDKLYLPPLNMALGLTVKIILTITLVNIPSINVYGAAFSDIACYFVATFLNLLYIIRVRKFSKKVGADALKGTA